MQKKTKRSSKQQKLIEAAYKYAAVEGLNGGLDEEKYNDFLAGKVNKFKKRDRVVTPDGLGHVVHVYNAEGTQITVNIYGRKIGYDTIFLPELFRPATSKDFKKGKAEIYKRADKKWDYRIIQKNGKLLASSKQGYQNRVDMIKVLNNNFIDFEIVQK